MMACSAIAMDALRMSSSPHPFYRNQSLLLLHHRPHPTSLIYRPNLVVSCKFSGHDRSSPPQDRRDQKQKLLSRFREGRRRKWLRLRGRLRLLQRLLRKWSLPVLLTNFSAYNRIHPKQVALSTLLGCTMALGCLYLRLTYVPAPHIVPYAVLIDYIQSGRVSSVLFEEGSRQVLFNMKPTEETSPLNVGIPSDSDITVVSSEVNNDDKNLKRTEQEMASPLEIPDSVPVCAEENTSTRFPNYMSDPKQVEAELEIGTDIHIQVERETTQAAEKQDATSFLEVMKSSAMIVREGWRLFTGVISSFNPISSVPELLSNAQPPTWQYSTRRVENDEAYLLGIMREKGVVYSSAPPPLSTAVRTTVFTILSLWIPLTPLFWLMYNQLSGGNMNQKWRSNSSGVNFGDVAGVDEAKVELVEIVSYLKGDMNFRRVNAKLPKGVLLVGPPGTGKTLLARAVAGEAGVPFFAASASEFVEMFVGRGAARIRDLFSNAQKCSPSIIFIDELDAVGGRRGRSFNDERDQTLNQLLTEMDGFETDTGVLVIAATNRPEALDPALCRPGRFSRKVFVREPDSDGRQQILSVHMRDVPIEGDIKVILNTVASMTLGFVGADLANVVNEAALLAVRAGREAVTIDDLKEAINRVKFGVGNKPTFSGAVERVFDWLQQPRIVRSTPLGYGTPFSSG